MSSIGRITTKGLSASFEWGVEDSAYDVVNMSYISGSVPAEVVRDLYKRAFAALEPGGKLVVHDFMVDNSQVRTMMRACVCACVAWGGSDAMRRRKARVAV